MNGLHSFIHSARRPINTTSVAPWNFGRAAEREGCLEFAPLGDLLRPVPPDILFALKSEGLQAAPTDGLATRLGAVDQLLARVPDLSRIVSRSVGAIHALVAVAGYDVSHSQPKWRDRVFVSFPERQDAIGELRLAESVVHEAMHLHLTNEEARVAFVARPTDELYSPWMDTIRSVPGVLHGLFTFSCIAAFLLRLAQDGSFADDACRYLAGRLAEIRQEILEVESAALEDALTPHGVGQTRLWKTAITLDCLH